MGRNQHQETGLGIMILIILLFPAEAENAQEKLVNHHQGQQEPAKGYHCLQERLEKSHFCLLLAQGTRPVRTKTHNVPI